MDATRDSHTKWSKSERERQIPYDITYIWNLIYGTNEPIFRIETDSTDMESRLVVALVGGRNEMDREFGLLEENYYI